MSEERPQFLQRLAVIACVGAHGMLSCCTAFWMPGVALVLA